MAKGDQWTIDILRIILKIIKFGFGSFQLENNNIMEVMVTLTAGTASA